MTTPTEIGLSKRQSFWHPEYSAPVTLLKPVRTDIPTHFTLLDSNYLWKEGNYPALLFVFSVMAVSPQHNFYLNLDSSNYSIYSEFISFPALPARMHEVVRRKLLVSKKYIIHMTEETRQRIEAYLDQHTTGSRAEYYQLNGSLSHIYKGVYHEEKTLFD